MKRGIIICLFFILNSYIVISSVPSCILETYDINSNNGIDLSDVVDLYIDYKLTQTNPQDPQLHPLLDRAIALDDVVYTYINYKRCNGGNCEILATDSECGDDSGGNTHSCEINDPCPINCGESLSKDVMIDKEYFTYNVTQESDVTITLSHGATDDYDLFTDWEGNVPTESVYGCKPGGPFTPEICSYRLSIGTYYIMVDKYQAQSSYNVNLECSTT